MTLRASLVSATVVTTVALVSATGTAAAGQTGPQSIPSGAGHVNAPKQPGIVTPGVRPPVVPNPNPPVIVLPVPVQPVIVIGPGGYYPYNPYYNPYWQRDMVLDRVVVGQPQVQPAAAPSAPAAPAPSAPPAPPLSPRQRAVEALKLEGAPAAAAARTALNEHLSASPKDTDAVRLLSLVLMREGKWRDAAATMALAYQTDPMLAASPLDEELVLAMARPRASFLRYANSARSAAGWLTALALLQADTTGPEKARANVLNEFLKRAEQNGLEARVADEFRKALVAKPAKGAAPAAPALSPAPAPRGAPAGADPSASPPPGPRHSPGIGRAA